jgi:hypothetical protein
VRYHAQVLGALVCDACGRERTGAEDKASWTIVMVGGVLTEVLCPRCR